MWKHYRPAGGTIAALLHTEERNKQHKQLPRSLIPANGASIQSRREATHHTQATGNANQPPRVEQYLRVYPSTRVSERLFTRDRIRRGSYRVERQQPCRSWLGSQKRWLIKTNGAPDVSPPSPWQTSPGLHERNASSIPLRGLPPCRSSFLWRACHGDARASPSHPARWSYSFTLNKPLLGGCKVMLSKCIRRHLGTFGIRWRY